MNRQLRAVVDIATLRHYVRFANPHSTVMAVNEANGCGDGGLPTPDAVVR